MRISCSATHIIAHITAWYAHIIAHITAWYACAYHTENTEHWPITQNSNRANIASPLMARPTRLAPFTSMTFNQHEKYHLWTVMVIAFTYLSDKHWWKQWSLHRWYGGATKWWRTRFSRDLWWRWEWGESWVSGVYTRNRNCVNYLTFYNKMYQMNEPRINTSFQLSDNWAFIPPFWDKH